MKYQNKIVGTGHTDQNLLICKIYIFHKLKFKKSTLVIFDLTLKKFNL